MYKIAIIVVWFGKLPSSFPIWLKSIEKNPSFDFHFFTDQNIEMVNSTNNFIIHNIEFIQLKKEISKILGFEVSLERSYKLCDFKPAYGEIFQKYLIRYDFWGHCDLDLVFGNLQKFITDEVLRNSKKILVRGHLTLYKNEETINHLYKKSKHIDYQKVFTSPEYWMLDEWYGINRIFDDLKIDQFKKEIMADINPNSAHFICKNIKNYKIQIFVWENGNLFQFYWENGEIHHREIAYIHFQKRKMNNNIDLDHFKTGMIIINSLGFNFYSGRITLDVIKKYNKKNYLHLFKRYYNRILQKVFPTKKKSVIFNKTFRSHRTSQI